MTVISSRIVLHGTQNLPAVRNAFACMSQPLDLDLLSQDLVALPIKAVGDIR